MARKPKLNYIEKILFEDDQVILKKPIKEILEKDEERFNKKKNKVNLFEIEMQEPFQDSLLLKVPFPPII